MNEKKDMIQKMAQSKWEQSNYRGAIGACTGSGKSKIFVNIISETPEKWLLVVPTVKLRDEGWNQEFKKWKKLSIYNKYVDKCCYASLKNYDLSKYTGICLDEGHNITQNNCAPFFINDVYKKLKILFLSATIPTEWEKKELMYRLNIQPVYTLSLDEGVKLGIVAPYKLKIVKIPLSTAEDVVVKYKKFGKENKFYTSEKKKYNYLTETIEKLKAKEEKITFAIFNRMRFIYNLKSKERVAKKLLSRISQNERTLVFSQSIKQVEELCNCTYHSKTSDVCYNDFIQGKLNRLGVVMSVNEGHNIPNLDVALIVQLNSKAKNLIQRIGRIVRYREGHEATIYILVAEGTIDENWLNTAMMSFDKSNVEYVDYKKIIN